MKFLGVVQRKNHRMLVNLSEIQKVHTMLQGSVKKASGADLLAVSASSEAVI